jgi:hypothetical protein
MHIQPIQPLRLYYRQSLSSVYGVSYDRAARSRLHFLLTALQVCYGIVVSAYAGLPVSLAHWDRLVSVLALLLSAVNRLGLVLVLLERASALEELAQMEASLQRQSKAAKDRAALTSSVFHEARVHLHAATMGLELLAATVPPALPAPVDGTGGSSDWEGGLP